MERKPWCAQCDKLADVWNRELVHANNVKWTVGCHGVRESRVLDAKLRRKDWFVESLFADTPFYFAERKRAKGRDNVGIR